MRSCFTRLFSTLLFAVAVWGPVATASAAEWPAFRGPNHDGKSTETGLLKQWPAEGPKLLWKATDIGKGYSTVSTDGSTILITGDVDDKFMLFAFDMNGKPQWKKEICPAWTGDHPGARSTPAIDGGNLYLLSATGLLGCYDLKTGAPKWSRKMEEFGGTPNRWAYAESPLIIGDSVMVKPGGTNFIVAMNKADGTQIWAGKGFTAASEYSSLVPFAFDNTPMLVTGSDAGLACFNAQTGAFLWSNEFSAKNTANCASPAYADGYVFWSNGYGQGGICMKLEPGGKATPAWTTKDMVCHHGGYIIDKGYIYGDNGKGVSCLDLKTGEVKWKDPAVGKGSLCWAEGMLYLFGEKEGQAALATCSPTGLEIEGKVKVDGEGPSWAYPVVAGGRLYLRYDVNLYCFDVKAK